MVFVISLPCKLNISPIFFPSSLPISMLYLNFSSFSKLASSFRRSKQGCAKAGKCFLGPKPWKDGMDRSVRTHRREKGNGEKLSFLKLPLLLLRCVRERESSVGTEAPPAAGCHLSLLQGHGNFQSVPPGLCPDSSYLLRRPLQGGARGLGLYSPGQKEGLLEVRGAPPLHPSSHPSSWQNFQEHPGDGAFWGTVRGSRVSDLSSIAGPGATEQTLEPVRSVSGVSPLRPPPAPEIDLNFTVY